MTDNMTLDNSFLANMTHSYQMSVGLKNDVGQIKDLVGLFDFAVNESCHQYDEVRGEEGSTSSDSSQW